MRIVREITIAAPHTVVWDLIDDDDRRKAWIPELVATSYPAGRPAGDPTGTRFRETMGDGASIRSLAGEITAHVTGRLRAVRLADPHLTMEIEYRLGRRGAATIVRYAGTFGLAGISGRGGGLLLRLARPLVEQRIADRLARLKTVAEEHGRRAGA